MKRSKKTMHTGFEAVQDQLATMGADLALLGSTLGEAASDETRVMIRSIQQRLDNLASEAGKVTRAGIDALEDEIQENPIASIAIAFGLGVLLTSIMRR